MFKPDFSRVRPPSKVVVVLGSRLVYRKGIDLVVEVIPRICQRVFSEEVTVDFIVAGDGPKRILFEEAIERHGLHSRYSDTSFKRPKRPQQQLNTEKAPVSGSDFLALFHFLD